MNKKSRDDTFLKKFQPSNTRNARASLALLRAEIALKRDVCSAPPPLSSKKRHPNFGGSAKDTQVKFFDTVFPHIVAAATILF